MSTATIRNHSNISTDCFSGLFPGHSNVKKILFRKSGNKMEQNSGVIHRQLTIKHKNANIFVCNPKMETESWSRNRIVVHEKRQSRTYGNNITQQTLTFLTINLLTN